MVLIQADVDPDDARQRAEEILSRQEFRLDEPGLLDRAVDWLLTRIGRILSALVPGDGTVLGYLVLGLVVVVLGYLIWRFAPRGRPGRHRVTTELVVVTDRSRNRASWLAEAERAEAGGDWAAVVNARYRALVSGLVDRSELDDDPGATSGEHRRRFSARSRDRFEDATDRFEEVRYGGRVPARADRDALVDDDRRLLDDGAGS